MKRIVSFILAAIAAAGCSKEIPVRLDHPVEVELPPDVQYVSDTLLYVNVSEEASVDFALLGEYVRQSGSDVFLARIKESDKEALAATVSALGFARSVCSEPYDGKLSVIASKGKIKASGQGNGWVAASLSCCSAVVGADSGTLMEETEGFDGRIFFLTSSSDPSAKFYKKTFCNCIAAQWGAMKPTSVTSLTDYIFARPSQWSDAGAISLDRKSPWKHYPMSFTIRKEL